MHEREHGGDVDIDLDPSLIVDVDSLSSGEETTPDQASARSAALIGTELGGVEHRGHVHDEDVAYETGDKIGDKVLESPRFLGDPVLEEVATGTATLKKGASGLAISRVQAALADLGHAVTRTGTFDDPTVTAVKAFQTAKGKPDSGEVDKTTLELLDQAFVGHGADAAIARAKTPPGKPTTGVEYTHGKAPKELYAGTRKPSKTEATEADSLLAPVQAVDKSTGKAVVFQEEIKGKGKYVDRLREVIDAVIDVQFARMGKGKAAEHANPANLHQLSDIANAGQASKDETDKVFGSYASGPAFNAASNLRDRWAVEEAEQTKLLAEKAKGGAAGKAAEKELEGIARWRVQKIVNSNRSVATLNAEHGAIVSRAEEKALIEPLIQEIATKRGDELREIHKGWPGAADPDTREVFLQLFKSSDAMENRKYMWDQFQTLVHEYVHTLNHSRYRAYSDKLSATDKAKSHTLREGVTEYLTKIVLSQVVYSDPLRKQVEGPYHDPSTKTPIPTYGGYAAAVEAEQVVGVVGASNMFAAYFLGDVELIGGSP